MGAMKIHDAVARFKENLGRIGFRKDERSSTLISLDITKIVDEYCAFIYALIKCRKVAEDEYDVVKVERRPLPLDVASAPNLHVRYRWAKLLRGFERGALSRLRLWRLGADVLYAVAGLPADGRASGHSQRSAAGTRLQEPPPADTTVRVHCNSSR